MGEKILEQEEIEKVEYKWFWSDKVIRFREVRSSIFGEIKEIKIRLCFKNHWKKVIKGLRNNWTIYPGTQNPNIYKSSQYY